MDPAQRNLNILLPLFFLVIIIILNASVRNRLTYNGWDSSAGGISQTQMEDVN